MEKWITIPNTNERYQAGSEGNIRVVYTDYNLNGNTRSENIRHALKLGLYPNKKSKNK